MRAKSKRRKLRKDGTHRRWFRCDRSELNYWLESPPAFLLPGCAAKRTPVPAGPELPPAKAAPANPPCHSASEATIPAPRTPRAPCTPAVDRLESCADLRVSASLTKLHKPPTAFLLICLQKERSRSASRRDAASAPPRSLPVPLGSRESSPDDQCVPGIRRCHPVGIVPDRRCDTNAHSDLARRD